jgi:hypothetical protein
MFIEMEALGFLKQPDHVERGYIEVWRIVPSRSEA